MEGKNIDERLLWLDLETTGSDEEHDCIIEIGCVLTDKYLISHGSFSSIVNPSAEGLGRLMMNDIVHKMHEHNGLLNEILRTKGAKEFDQHNVTKRLLNWINDSTLGPDVAIAGSGVGHFDMRFIRRYMPQLARRCKHWTYDIGVVRRFHEIFVGTEVSRENGNKTHRALDDAMCHLREAQAFAELWRKTNSGRADG